MVRRHFLERPAQRKLAIHLMRHALQRVCVLEKRHCGARGRVHHLHDVRPVDPGLVECLEAQAEVEHALTKLHFRGAEYMAPAAVKVVGEGSKTRPPPIDPVLELRVGESIHPASETCDHSIGGGEATRHRWRKAGPVGFDIGTPADTAGAFGGVDGGQFAQHAPDLHNILGRVRTDTVVSGQRDGDLARLRFRVDGQLQTNREDLAVLAGHGETGERVEDFERADRGESVRRKSVNGGDATVVVEEGGPVVRGNFFADRDVPDGS